MQGKESRKYTMVDYNKVLFLKKQGFSQYKIGEKIGVSPTTVWRWVNTKRKPRYIYAKKQQRKLASHSKRLSKDLAYIMGVLIGDGYLEISKKNKRVCLYVKDKDFAIHFYNILKKWSGLRPLIDKRRIKSKHWIKYGHWIRTDTTMYTTRLSSVQAVSFLKDKIKCKTYDWEVPKIILKSKNKGVISAFLKGFFDSEGSAILFKQRGRIEATILNPNNGLEEIQGLLAKLGIRSTIRPRRGHSTYIIRILDRESMALFCQKVDFTIERKKLLLRKILKSYKGYAYDGEKTRKEILFSIRNKPKTIKEICLGVGKHYNTARYHLMNLKRTQVIVVGKIREETRISNLWSLV